MILLFCAILRIPVEKEVLLRYDIMKAGFCQKQNRLADAAAGRFNPAQQTGRLSLLYPETGRQIS